VADEKALAESLRRSHPHPKDVLQVYRALCTQYHIPVATNEPVDHLFDMPTLCKRFRLDAFTTYHCLKILEKDGWIALSESFHAPSRVQVIVGKEALYQAQMSDEVVEEVLTTILRNYEGVFLEPVRISESRIARMTDLERQDVIDTLTSLARDEVITYVPSTDLPRLIFLHPRVEFKNVCLDETRLRELRMMAAKRVDAVFGYLREDKCRQLSLLRYFAEESEELCGKCDLCIARGDPISADDILDAIPAKGIVIKDLIHQFGNARRELVKARLADLEAEELIRITGDSVIRLKHSKS
jgi:ATP-dependent DNA helicase RecQ